jgi:hypothetical protein
MWLTTADCNAQIADAAAAGVQSIRADVPWHTYEPDQGAYNAAYVPRIDTFVDSAAAAGIEVVFCVTDAPEWASGATYPDPAQRGPTPAHYVDYANFLEYLMRRYNGAAHAKVSAWEIWNEPNGAWAWVSPDPAAYEALLQVAYTRAKSVDPACTILGVCIASTDSAASAFLSAVYAAGARNYFDVLSIHTYTPWSGVDPFAIAVQWHTVVWEAISTPYGDVAKPVWITETGLPSYGGAEAAQATFDTGMLSTFRKIPLVQRVHIYTLATPDTGDPGQNFYGIEYGTTAPFTKKPAWTAYRDLPKLPATSPTTLALHGSTPVPAKSTVGTPGTPVTSASFSPPAGSTLIVLWGADSNRAFDVAPTITDSLGTHLIWTLVRYSQAGSGGGDGEVAVYWANCPAAQTNMTVTMTSSNATIGSSAFQVLVFTGASYIPIGAEGGGNALSPVAPPSSTYTSTTANSQGWMVWVDETFTGLRGASTPLAGCTEYVRSESALVSVYFFRRTSTTSTPGTSVTIGASAPSDSGRWIYVEVIPN